MLCRTDSAYMSATAARRALVSGTFSAVDYVCDLLEQIKQANGDLCAFISLSRKVRADRQRAANRPLALLHSLPFAVKDLIDVRGTRTSGNSSVTAAEACRTGAGRIPQAF